LKGEDYVYHGKTKFKGIHTMDELKLTKAQQEQFGCEKVDGIFPEYYLLCVENFDNVAKTPLDEWISFLKTTKVPEKATAPGMDAVRDKLSFDQLTSEEKREYFQRLDDLEYERSVISSGYTEGYLLGHDDGVEEGMKEGMEEGIKRGIKKGINQRNIELAKSMKSAGISIEQIIKFTGLDIDIVNKL
jgi:predicted transposase/invertase (TIGR01784 family)